MTNYTFSVVATNSIGSGEAGAVMITTPGKPYALFVYTRMIKKLNLKKEYIDLCNKK